MLEGADQPMKEAQEMIIQIIFTEQENWETYNSFTNTRPNKLGQNNISTQ